MAIGSAGGNDKVQIPILGAAMVLAKGKEASSGEGDEMQWKYKSTCEFTLYRVIVLYAT